MDDQKEATTASHTKELINHISREIDTHTKSMIEWRIRAAFYWLLGPFLVVGSFVIATMRFATLKRPDWIAVTAAFCAFASFMAIAVIGALIERHVWNQCNRWRRAILIAANDRGPGLVATDLVFEHRIIRCYFWSHICVIAALVSFVIFIARITPSSPETQPAPPPAAIATDSSADGPTELQQAITTSGVK